MTLDEIMDRASVTPNADLDCFLAGEVVSSQRLAVSLDPTHAVRLIDADGGLAPIGTDGALYLGQAQNAPPEGCPAVVRIAGITRCIYGADIAVGDRLALDVATSRLIPFDTDYGDGHHHTEAIAIIRRVVYVVGSFDGLAATGVSGSLSTSLQWDNGGSFSAAGETVSVSEIGSGEYLVSYTPDNVATNYRLRVSSPADYVVTPAEFQDTSTARVGAPSAATLKLIVGTAITSGADGDEGYMLISRQIF
jgi:hypothetical protein